MVVTSIINARKEIFMKEMSMLNLNQKEIMKSSIGRPIGKMQLLKNKVIIKTLIYNNKNVTIIIRKVALDIWMINKLLL